MGLLSSQKGAFGHGGGHVQTEGGVQGTERADHQDLGAGHRAESPSGSWEGTRTAHNFNPNYGHAEPGGNK